MTLRILKGRREGARDDRFGLGSEGLRISLESTRLISGASDRKSISLQRERMILLYSDE